METVINSLSVDIALFDKQHAKLLKGLTAFQEHVRLSADKEDLLWMIDDLIAKTEEHFNSEEELMMEYCFEGYGEHKKVHDEFLGMLNDCRTDYAQRLRYVNLDYLIIDIHRWIVNHITNYDKRYIFFFKKINID